MTHDQLIEKVADYEGTAAKIAVIIAICAFYMGQVDLLICII